MTRIDTVADLAKAYDEGILDRDENFVTVDNDCVFLYVDEEIIFHMDLWEWTERLADLAQIPTEPA